MTDSKNPDMDQISGTRGSPGATPGFVEKAKALWRTRRTLALSGIAASGLLFCVFPLCCSAGIIFSMYGNFGGARNEKAIKVYPSQIRKAYQDNRLAADQAWKGKLMLIEGEIDHFHDRGFSLSSLSNLSCNFPDSRKLAVAKLKKGERVSVTGRFNGTELDDCEFTISAPSLHLGKGVRAAELVGLSDEVGDGVYEMTGPSGTIRVTGKVHPKKIMIFKETTVWELEGILLRSIDGTSLKANQEVTIEGKLSRIVRSGGNGFQLCPDNCRQVKAE